jgi:hypothetical protein
MRRWSRVAVGVEPIRQALRDSVRMDRTTQVLRKLPAVIAKLSEFSSDVPWSMNEALAGVIDAAVLSDDHGAVVHLIERAAMAGQGSRFARLVDEELESPLRLAWLVERLRSGLPADVGGLRSWLGRLGASAAPLLLTAIEAGEQWQEQELFAEALAAVVGNDPELVSAALKKPRLKSVAALCFALELGGAEGREAVWRALLNEGDEAMELEVLTGRARAMGGQALELLRPHLDAPSPELKARATQLMGELLGADGFELLSSRLEEPRVDALDAAQLLETWAALLECGGDEALELAKTALSARAPLLKRRAAIERRLAVIDALRRVRTEGAWRLLEAVAKDSAFAGELRKAASTALEARPVDAAVLEPLSRSRLLARAALELALLARAATTIGTGGGQLDPAIERLRDALKQLIAREGHAEIAAGTEGPTVNGSAVDFGPFHAAAARVWELALRSRDLKSLSAAENAPTTAELRSFLYRAFDPEGRHEPLSNLSALTFTGEELKPLPAELLAPDSTAGAAERFAKILRWLETQSALVSVGQSPDLHGIDATLEDLTTLLAESDTEFCGVARHDGSARGKLTGALNAGLLTAAFAQDLGLPRPALREALELAVMSGLAQTAGDEALQRLHAAGLSLTHRLNRLGTALAIAAVETGARPDRYSQGASVLAALHAICAAYDGLTAKDGENKARALELMNGKLRTRFNPELLGLFTQWAFAQP